MLKKSCFPLDEVHFCGVQGIKLWIKVALENCSCLYFVIFRIGLSNKFKVIYLKVASCTFENLHVQRMECFDI